MRVLMIGDVYAKSGREVYSKHINDLIKNEKIDFVVLNGENTTNGKSLSLKHYEFYKQHHVDVITSGNNIFKNKEVVEYINFKKDLLKPLNMPSSTPGNGYVVIEKNNLKICVLNLMGNVFMDHCNNVFEKMDDFLSKKIKYDILLVDFHAEATAEKIAFAKEFDGIITAFVGTHTHVQTADERILPKGTAFISDIGMCGVIDSVIGSDASEVIYRSRTGINKSLKPALGVSQLNAVVIDIDNKTCKATSIKRINIK